LSGKNITILGVKTDCSCEQFSKFPLSLAPKKIVNFSVSFVPMSNDFVDGYFTKSLQLFSDVDMYPLFLTITVQSDVESVENNTELSPLLAPEFSNYN
jgi:hypothetical protein